MARAPWNLRMSDNYPAAVAYPAFPEEVADVIRAAAAAGLSVAAQGTGHGGPALEGRLGDAVLLRTSAMGEVTIDVENRTARVGAGVLWGDLVEAAGAHGLAALHPSSPDVGVVGYSIGGGIGWYARQLGLQCNSVTAAELVLADGKFVRATAEDDDDLLGTGPLSRRSSPVGSSGARRRPTKRRPPSGSSRSRTPTRCPLRSAVAGWR